MSAGGYGDWKSRTDLYVNMEMLCELVQIKGTLGTGIGLFLLLWGSKKIALGPRLRSLLFFSRSSYSISRKWSRKSSFH